MKPLISLLLSLVFAVTLFAQKEDVAVETDLPATLVRAVKLPLPDYPEAAKNAGLRGMVSVDVTLDEEGKVLYAENARGPYPVCQSVTDPAVMALRNSALAAAKEASFQGVDGQAVPGKGRITYNFGSDVETVEPESKGRDDRMTVIGETDTGAARIVTAGEPEKSVDASPNPKIGPGGVLNGKALTLPKPRYPPAAKAVRATGSVSVQVLIWEDGSIYSAAAVSGHPLLRASSEMAACNATFSPTLFQGKPVKVSGVIFYNYVP